MRKEESDIIAKAMMKEIMYDNGAVDRNHPENYPQKWIDKISVAAGKFFDANEGFLADKSINEICCGEQSEIHKTYGGLEGWDELNNVLNDYHAQI